MTEPSPFQVFAHEAVIELDQDADERAPGGAVTVALCGHWEHDGGCRWPHHTASVGRTGRTVRVRVVFGCVADGEPVVRGRIAEALDAGRLSGPTGPSGWRVVSQGAAAPDSAERELAAGWAAPDGG